MIFSGHYVRVKELQLSGALLRQLSHALGVGEVGLHLGLPPDLQKIQSKKRVKNMFGSFIHALKSQVAQSIQH